MAQGLQLSLQALEMPDGSPWLGGPNEHNAFQVQYIEIAGGENFNGINFGPDTPSVDAQSLPWLETDALYNPVAWRSWNGSEWAEMAKTATAGETAGRPVSPVDYQVFWDTTIECEIIWYGGSWHTRSGSKGDIKYVDHPTLAQALTYNPGWSHYTKSLNRTLANAGGTYTYETTAGSDNLYITKEQLPNVKIPLETIVNVSVAASGGGDGANIEGTAAAHAGTKNTGSPIDGQTEALGSGTAMENRQPTLYTWCLIKD